MNTINFNLNHLNQLEFSWQDHLQSEKLTSDNSKQNINLIFYISRLKEYYNIPIISVRDIAKWVVTLPGEEYEQCREIIEGKKLELVEAANEKRAE